MYEAGGAADAFLSEKAAAKMQLPGLIFL